MSSANEKKRSAEENLSSPAPKRAAINKKDSDVEILDDEDDRGFHIEVELHERFKVFPDALRKILQDLYKNTVRSQMTALVTKTPPKYRYTYSVISEVSTLHSPHGPNITVLKANVPARSLCNMALLNIFLKSRKSIVPKAKFVCSLAEPGSTNPDFTRLQSVRHGEMGWGFDVTGCLALHVPFIEQNRKIEYNIYVKRTVLKVEGET